MRLKNITATPYPEGNKIVLRWTNPDPDQYPGVRVVRREGTHSTEVDDGIVVAEGEGLSSAVDGDLKGETMYYYTLFPYTGAPPEYHYDRHNRTAAMATAPYNMAGRMYELLPRIYHRYDTVLPDPGEAPAEMSQADRQRGQLRRFLELPGGQLDLIHSFARAMLNLYNIDKVDGRLLPLLAQWIAWSTDYRLEIDAQRNEVRNAPHLYKTIGIIPTVEATVKRMIDWESRTKEFVHNVFLSNRPEQINLWLHQRNNAGEWSEPDEPLSLDFAYEGRPAAVRDGDGVFWLFYHTLRNDRWDIFYKKFTTFSIALGFQIDLDSGTISEGLRKAFEDEGFSLSQDALIQETNGEWLITDADSREIYVVRREAGQLNVYLWASKPLTKRKGRDDRHPTVVAWNGSLWVFWDSYDHTSEKWRIDYRFLNGEDWSPIAMLTTDPPEDPVIERRSPQAVIDDAGYLWLFWLEKEGDGWQLKYNRYDGASWEAASVSNFLSSARDFPLEAGANPRVGSDLFVILDSAATQRIWIFWSRKEPIAGLDQTRWRIVYRIKANTDPSDLNWDKVSVLPRTASDYNDREPAALIDAGGDIEFFWSSDQEEGWSIWCNSIKNVVTDDWEESAEQITNSPYSQRNPLPVSLDGGVWLFYHSNQSLTYTSSVYAATKTLDTRYAGCTTVEERNAAKIALREHYKDFQTYTYDTGMQNDNWYARDTIGIYLNPDTDDPERIVRNQHLLEGVLREFLPIQVRPVFIIPLASSEMIYTYDFPEIAPPLLIEEQFSDTIGSTTIETYTGLSDNYVDTVPGWIWMRSWSELYADHRTVDFTASTIDTRFRTWHIGLEAGG